MGFSTESCVFQVGCESVLLSVSEGESRAGPGLPPAVLCTDPLLPHPFTKRAVTAGEAEQRLGLHHHIPLTHLLLPQPRHIAVKPSGAQTLSLPVGAVKGMEEELGSNKEMLGKCRRTNAASSLLWVFAARGCVMPWKRDVPFDLAQSGCHQPWLLSLSLLLCYYYHIMPELLNDL